MTTNMKQPSRLDLYVEKIVAYMNLDDTQRQEVARELHSHLEESIASAMSRDMTRDQAEEAAMEQFGKPKVLAGQFGTARGKMWIIVETIAYALMMFAIMQWNVRLVPNRPDFVTNAGIFAVAALFAAIAFFKRSWERVQVNGALRVYRFLRPTLIIPFESIDEVWLDRLHMVGPRKIRIRYANGKKASYSTGWPNARCIGIALEVLSADAIKPKTAEFFRKLRLRSGKESTIIKAGLTAGWITLSLMFAVTFPLLWSGEGVSLLFALTLLGSMIWLYMQHYSHTNRTKRAISLLLIGAWLIFIPAYASYALFTDEGPRSLAVLIALLLPLPVVIIWWRGKNRPLLFAVSILWVGAAFLGAKNTPDNVTHRSNSVPLLDGAVLNSNWIDTGDTQPSLAALGVFHFKNADNKELPPLLAIVKKDKVTKQKLPEGKWFFLGPGNAGQDQLLIRDFVNQSPKPTTGGSELFRLTKSGALTKLREIPNINNHWAAIINPNVLVSPGAQFFLTNATSVDTSVSVNQLAAVNIISGRMSQFPDFKIGQAWRWETSTTLEAIKPYGQNANALDGNIGIWKLDTETGDAKFERRLSIGPGNTLLYAPSKTHALVRGKRTFAMADLENGTSVTLPLPAGRDVEYSWEPRRNEVAYLASGTASNNLLVVAGPSGVLLERTMNSRYQIAQMDISPDGEKIFLAMRRMDSWMFPLAQLCVWNLKDESFKKIGRAGFFGTTLSFLKNCSTDTYPSVRWTPDSHSIMWHEAGPMYSNKGVHLGTFFRLIHYASGLGRMKRGDMSEPIHHTY